jgi:membrane protease YdiL (CAAX protease family)
MDGHTGRVLIGEIPITRKQRAMWALLAFVGFILGGIGGEFAYRGYFYDTANYLIGGIAAAVLGVIMTILGVRILVMPQREEKG